MKFCTKTQDLLKAYNKATNDLLIELLERSGYSDTCFYKYENRKPKGCKSDEGTEFQSGDGSDDRETISGYWVGGDIGDINNEELVIWFIKPEILKQAVELKTANIEDVFDYYNYYLSEEEAQKETENQRPVLTFKNWYKLK